MGSTVIPTRMSATAKLMTKYEFDTRRSFFFRVKNIHNTDQNITNNGIKPENDKDNRQSGVGRQEKPFVKHEKRHLSNWRKWARDLYMNPFMYDLFFCVF